MQRWLKIAFTIFGILLTAGFLPSPVFATTKISLKTPNEVISFTVEIADTPAKRSKGLMGRTFLAHDHGMLFIFAQQNNLSFWMKNTPLSLDIIFFNKDREYVSHHANTEPFSEQSLRSLAPAQYALEVNAGLAEEKKIGAGSLLILPHALD